MFKKKKQEVKVVVDYSKFREDLGFLHMVMDRKITIVSTFNIEILRTQLSGSNITDSEINEHVENIAREVIETLSEDYLKFLESKYFKSRPALLSYIVENTYVNLTTSGIKANQDILKDKIRETQIKKLAEKNSGK